MNDQADAPKPRRYVTEDDSFANTTLIYVSGCRTCEDLLLAAQQMSDLPLRDLSPFGHGGAGEHCGDILRAMLADPEVCTLVRPTSQQLQNSGFLVDVVSNAGMIYLAGDVLPGADFASLSPQQQQIFAAFEADSVYVQPEAISPDNVWDGWHLVQPGQEAGQRANDAHDAFCLTLLAGFSRRFQIDYALRLATAAAAMQSLGEPASGWREIMEYERRHRGG